MQVAARAGCRSAARGEGEGSDGRVRRRHSRRKYAAPSTSSSSALKVRKDRKPRHKHRRKDVAPSTSSSSALKVRKDRKPRRRERRRSRSDDDDYKRASPSLPPLQFSILIEGGKLTLKVIDFGLSDFVKPGHPWIRDAQQVKIPLDMIIYKLMRAYISSSTLRKSALRQQPELRQHIMEQHCIAVELQGRGAAEASEQEYEKEKLNERIAKLSGGVAVIQVGAQTETELKEKKLRVEDALNATKAAVEEGIVVGGGCTLLRLASKVDAIKETLENDEQKVGAEIVRKSLSYPLKLIAKNAGVNGSVVTEKVLVNDNFRYDYNAATGKYEDLMAAGIIDPTKVVRCCLEHVASVAKTFITSDAVVVDIKESEQAPAANPMVGSGYGF
ncbi:ruBisCO large subunit-binding protein subunit beta, chloroplastic-like [Hordeum vulgare subsp. vulgare]|uniref:ruBisCO large subunit-binding protein subunit beta, chloroplastic-like n=1 Tax=Hordeum vulgare subsp. vulgare TaxID=112509 RepID=UPI001D1A5A68|nr:ruBisCO large subunit-binding protein subunit beta, chloroplastic-like [Hordeum vulgare subsp. vulgare]